MTASDLESIRYIGKRLRSWRQERDWSGHEAATYLAANLCRAVEWPELRSYEEGTTLPDTPTAEHLAAMHDRCLADLLLRRSAFEHVASAPWPPRSPSPEDLDAVEELLEGHGHDPRHAEHFFQLGLSKNAAGKWIRAFKPEDAFEWIAVRTGLIEATKWSKLGYSVGEAMQLKPLRLSPEQITALRNNPLSQAGVSIEVIVARGELGLDDDASVTPWVEQGWDLLASIPWSLAGFDPSSAKPWKEGGFDPLWAKRLAPSFGPAEARCWSATAVEPTAWKEWRSTGFSPSDANEFVAIGFTTSEAAEWSEAKFSAHESSAYRGAGLDVTEADAWRAIGLPAGEVSTWLDLDLEPTDAKRWRSVSTDPAAISALSKSGLSPMKAQEWLTAGVETKAVARWDTAGLSPQEAKAWAGSSPDRAVRLLARGVTPDVDRARRDVGAERVALARAALAERRAPLPQKHRHSARGKTRPQRDGPTAASHCHACGLAVGVNARCGCS